MELDEAARRIFRRRLPLVVLAVLLSVGLVGGLEAGRPVSYEAAAAVSAGADAPVSPVQAQAPVDRIRALATLPSMVAGALRRAGVARDVDDVARHAVSVRALGGSSVVQIVVRDRSAAAAAGMAQGLADEVVEALDPRRDPALRERLAAMGAEEKQLRADRTSVLAAALTPELTGRQLDVLDASLSNLDAARRGLVGTAALRPRPVLLERAAVPGRPVPSRLRLDLLLGGLLGLAAGIAIAALCEIARPGMTGVRSIAAALSVPAIGSLRRGGGDASAVARRLRLLAATRGADTVVLVPVRPQGDDHVQLARLAQAVADDTPRQVLRVGLGGPVERLLRASGPTHTVISSAPASALTYRSRSVLRVCSVADLQPEMLPSAVAVALTPPSVRQADLNRMLDICAASGVALVGVIGRSRSRFGGRS